MTDEIIPGDAVLYMKVGMHAQESLDDIIARKQREIDQVGYAMWGYGGNTCHPRTMVQPFAQRCADDGLPFRLVMEPVTSNHDRAPRRATRYSLDEQSWHEVPTGINVLGSRFALCIAGLRATDEELALGATSVAFGRQEGKPGTDYLRGQADKALLRVGDPTVGPGRVAKIELEAYIVEPWSVFVRD